MKSAVLDLWDRSRWLLAHAKDLHGEAEAARQRSLHHRAMSDLARQRSAQKRLVALAVATRSTQGPHTPLHVPRIGYTVTTSKNGTYNVKLVERDCGICELIGEFTTMGAANTFIQRMRELDAGPSHKL